MKIYKNKGFSKPAVLAATAVAIVAATGAGAWYVLKNKNANEVEHIEDETTRDFISNVDMSSAISVASELQNAVITNNYIGTDILVRKLRELQFTEKTGQPASTMNKEELNAKVDISTYMVPGAIENIENKIKLLNRDLNGKMSSSAYKETLNALSSIFKFFTPKSEETKIIAEHINAYNAYVSHPEYMISDIRAMYGPYNALAVCRYIIGLNDYSRMSAQEVLDHIVRESRHLIKQIPIQINDKQKHYSAADFTEINTRKLYELSDIDLNLPNIISYVLLINDPSILIQQKDKAYNSLKEAYQNRVNASQLYLFRAKTFFQCQATTSTSFGVEIKRLSKVIPNVSKLGPLTLNAVRAYLSFPLKGCADIDEVYILFPDLKEYDDLMVRGQNTMSDEEREMVKRDLELIKKFTSSTPKIKASISSSDIAATENPLELNPEQGYFIARNPNQSGLLFNLMLPSVNLLRTLNISPEVEPVFADNIQSVHKRKQAIFKLSLIEDYNLLENDLAELNFERLSKEAFKYISERNKNNKDIIKHDNASEYAISVRGFDNSGVNALNTVENTGPDSNNTINADINVASNEPTIGFSNSTTSEGLNTIAVSSSNDNGVNDNTLSFDSENNGTTIVAVTTNSQEPENNTNINQQNNESNIGAGDIATNETKSTTTEVTQIAKPNELIISDNIDSVGLNDTTNTSNSSTKFMNEQELRKASINIVQNEANKNSTNAMYELAIRYISGTKGAKRDHKTAAEILQKIKTLTNEKRADALLGSLYYSSNTFNMMQKKEGASLVLQAAASGEEEAYGTAGAILLEGKLANRDYAQAFNYLRLATENDDRRAQYNLATMYMQGKGVKKDLAKAYPLLNNASKSIPEAAFELAELVKSDELPNAHDEALAEELYIQAAEAGIRKAYKYAGIAILHNGGNIDVAIKKYLSGYTGKNDKEVDAALLSYYVKKNNRKEISKLIASAPPEVQAQFPVETANLYVKGTNGYTRDLTKAERLYRQGISANIAEAYCGLGNLFFTVKGRKHDARAAANNYAKGAELGAFECVRNLGVLYSTELYHTKYTEGVQLLEKARAMQPNDTIASGLLALMKAYGIGVKKNEGEAISILKTVKNSNVAKGVRLILEGDPLRMQQAACGNTFLALASGLKSQNKAWYAYATMTDLLAYGDYLKKGGTGTFDNIKFEAGKVCRTINITILHDAKGFKYSTDNSTPEKQYKNAMALFAGNGVAKDYDEAYKLMQQAASAKYPKALNNLGVFQVFGIGTKPMSKDAFTNLIQASGKGDGVASLNSAAVRKYGWGTGRADSGKAMDLIYNAASNRNPVANQHLYYGYHYGLETGVKKNDEQAYRFIALTFLDEQKFDNK